MIGSRDTELVQLRGDQEREEKEGKGMIKE